MCALLFSQADLAGGEGTGDPQQVESLEGDQHKANVGRQVFGTLWVHEVVCGSAAGILFVPYSGSQVHPGTHRSNWIRPWKRSLTFAQTSRITLAFHYFPHDGVKWTNTKCIQVDSKSG